MIEWTLKFRTCSSRILMGYPLERLQELAVERRMLLVTDAQVWGALGHRLPGIDVVQVGMGEAQKTLSCVEQLYEAFMKRELDRSSLVVGLGGGIVTDMTGFAASTYQRGLAFGFVPTTLLSQVDASIGGKNGVNYKSYKNMIGVIRQPEFVLIDSTTLSSLPDAEYRNGLAEVVKAACIRDRALFDLLEEHAEEVLNRDAALMARVLERSVAVKRDLVEADEEEKGERMLLNFGHTLGHAIEKSLAGVVDSTQKRQAISHGEAVAIGSVAAARLSCLLGLLGESDAERLQTLLQRLRLPTSLEPALREKALGAIRMDKKRRGNQINWVLLEALGQGIVHPLSLSESEALLQKVDL